MSDTTGELIVSDFADAVLRWFDYGDTIYIGSISPYMNIKQKRLVTIDESTVWAYSDMNILTLSFGGLVDQLIWDYTPAGGDGRNDGSDLVTHLYDLYKKARKDGVEVSYKLSDLKEQYVYTAPEQYKDRQAEVAP